MKASYAEVRDELATLEELLTCVAVLGEDESITTDIMKQVEEKRKAVNIMVRFQFMFDNNYSKNTYRKVK